MGNNDGEIFQNVLNFLILVKFAKMGKMWEKIQMSNFTRRADFKISHSSQANGLGTKKGEKRAENGRKTGKALTKFEEKGRNAGEQE